MAEIRADLVGDSRGLVKSIDKVGDALDDVVDELKDVDKGGDKTEDSLEENFRAIAKAAKAADESVENIGGTTKRTMSDAGGKTAEFKDEAKQNFSEVASSFSGDMSSAADLVQGTLGGLAGSLGGPLGLALGAASIALGAVIAQAQEDAEKAEELRLVAVENVKAAFEEGVDVGTFSTAVDQVIAKIQELEESKEGTGQRWFWEEDPSRLEEWSDALKTLGGEQTDIADNIAATSDELRRQERAYKRNKDAIDKEVHSLMAKSDMSSEEGKRLGQLQDQSQAYEVLIKNVDELADTREAEQDSAKRQADVGIAALQARADAEEAAVEAAQDAADRRQDIADSVTESATAMYDSIRDAAVDAATSEEGVFDLNKWLDLVAQSKTQADLYRQNLASMKLTPEQWENFLSLPEATRASIAQSYVVADEGTKTSITSALSDAGSSAGTGAAVAFDESFNPSPADVDIDVDANTEQVAADISKVAKAPYVATVKVKTDSSVAAARKQLDAIAKARTVTVRADADTWQAQRDLDAFVRRNTGRRIKVYADVVPGRNQVV